MSNRKGGFMSFKETWQTVRRAVIGPTAEEVFAPLHEKVEQLTHDTVVRTAQMYDLLVSTGFATEEDKQIYSDWRNGLSENYRQEIDTLYPNNVVMAPGVENTG
jgi:hypothetical protein